MNLQNFQRFIFYISLSIVLTTIAMGIELIPERVQVKYQNPKYLANVSASVRRYGRRSPYYLNVNSTVLQTWTNNVSIQFKFSEYLHNEYRESFVDITIKLCDFFNTTRKYMERLMKRVGMDCPLPPGRYLLNNLSTAEVGGSKFNYKFPMDKGMVSVYFRREPTKELIAEGYIWGRAKN